MTDLFLCGWRVRSDIPLPELAPWTGEDRAPDITIRLGAAPVPEGAIEVSPLLRVRQDGAAHLAIEAVARYLLAEGREITIEPALGAETTEIRVFLLGTMFGLLCHWRGLFPLHASCLEIGGGAVAFSGKSGAGKSTMAATLARRGHPLLSDDVCVIDVAAAGGPVVLPAFPRVKLWQDSLDAVGIDPVELERNRPEQNKYHFRFTEVASFATAPVPLKAIYFLNEAKGPTQIGFERLQGIESIASVRSQVYRWRSAQAWGFGPKLFQSAGRIATSTAIHRLIRHNDLTRLQETAAMLEAHVGS